MSFTTQLWTDASYDLNYKKAGLSVIIIRRNAEEVTYISKNKNVYCEDNNEAELRAILLGLKGLTDKDRKIAIITDSKVAKNAILSGHGKYTKILKEIRTILDNLNTVKIYNKKGHEKSKNKHNVLNNTVDILANIARKYR